MTDEIDDFALMDDPTDPNDLYEQSPQDLFGAWSSTFEDNLNLFWKELIRLNALVFIIRKVASFPFHLFEPLDQDYWVMSFGSMYDTCVLMEYRIWFDRRKNVITLPKLRTDVEGRISHGDFAKQLKKRFTYVSGLDHLINSENRFKNARHNRIAHLSREFLIGQSREETPDDEPSISDVGHVAKTLSEYFKCLCFGSGRSVHPLNYSPDIIHPVESDSRTDIEKILDVVARDSALLNMPEQQPEFWPVYRDKNISAKDLKIINQYRTKFGLPEAP